MPRQPAARCAWHRGPRRPGHHWQADDARWRRPAGIVGSGRGTVLSVAASGVTLRGLRIAGSGESHDGVDAGILLEGDDHRSRTTSSRTCCSASTSSRSIARASPATRSPASRSSRACAATRSASGTAGTTLIENNRFSRARDLTFANSPDNRIAGNRFVDGRYGMHVIFSPRLLIENNHLSHTGTGIIVLYSPDLVLRGNHVAHALTGGGGGIVFKESHDALVEGNEVLHCSVGLRVDAPPEVGGQADGARQPLRPQHHRPVLLRRGGRPPLYRQPLREAT
jgi:nitrous oxidase accessory protein